MYLVPYSAPSAKTQVQSHSPGKGETFVEVPENDERVWMIIFNPGTSAVRIFFGDSDLPSFEIAPRQDRTLPSPCYHGKFRSDGTIVVTEMLKNA
jgi:hypothetical protein